MTEEMKKHLLGIIGIIILFLLPFVVVWYLSHQKAVKECKLECVYNSEKEEWRYGSGTSWGISKIKKFQTQEQCVEHCLIVR